ncbi:UBX domain-containing protein 8 isoform X2 [Perognathus longimembris pacificus]|uniref:UBX domain-containing protein 8 isoform X2 n=1 Tax=Perognathus longimembris pacificus TaxID=214514 RepID=UPI002018C0DA|nr:UBX domain-containing protein 8 isoform X2 [Perognathus longimembris pacificus]
MASRGVVGVFLLAALPLLCLELRRGIPELGIKDLILLCGRIFLLLALLTLVISVTTSVLNSFKSSKVYLREEGKEEEEKELRQRQRLVRKRQQEAQGEKATRYIENVLKPQQEMKLKKMEERFYQITGETWKLTSGHKLGGDEDLVLGNASHTSSETSNREAAKRRNLAKLATAVSPPAERPWPMPVLNLPEEPDETDEEVITIAVRRPSGSVLRRRFLKSWSSQVLFDWMRTVGFHPSVYSLSTAFPRKPLPVEAGGSLADLGLTGDTVLIVEEKEPSCQERKDKDCSSA